MKAQYSVSIQNHYSSEITEEQKVLMSVTMEKAKKCKKCVCYGAAVSYVKVHSLQWMQVMNNGNS